MLEFIATHITNNIRELEGALIRVCAYASLTKRGARRSTWPSGCSPTSSRDSQPRPITPDVILEKTSEMFGFTIEEIQGKSRRRPLVTARQIGMYVFRELTDLSYPAIAREFGGRDHTTVIHAVEKIGALMKERRQIYDQVTELTQTDPERQVTPTLRQPGGQRPWTACRDQWTRPVDDGALHPPTPRGPMRTCAPLGMTRRTTKSGADLRRTPSSSTIHSPYYYYYQNYQSSNE